MVGLAEIAVLVSASTWMEEKYGEAGSTIHLYFGMAVAILYVSFVVFKCWTVRKFFGRKRRSE